jgi:hypothetical protein
MSAFRAFDKVLNFFLKLNVFIPDRFDLFILFFLNNPCPLYSRFPVSFGLTLRLLSLSSFQLFLPNLFIGLSAQPVGLYFFCT